MKLNIHSLSALLLTVMGASTVGTAFATHNSWLAAAVGFVGLILTTTLGVSYQETAKELEAQARALETTAKVQAQQVLADTISEAKKDLTLDAQIIAKAVATDTASLAPKSDAPGAIPATPYVQAITQNGNAA